MKNKSNYYINCRGCGRPYFYEKIDEDGYCEECGKLSELEKGGGIPIHNKCGLPVELCQCPDARIVFDNDTGKYIDKGKK